MHVDPYADTNIPEEIRRSQVVVWNPRPAEAGEQAQIDYGQLPPDRHSGTMGLFR